MYRVLLVDDELYVRAMLRCCIKWEDYGFEVVGEAENGEEALTRIREVVPDLVIIDIEMPFIDGLELAHRINTEYGGRIRVVFLTCYDRFEYAIAALKEDADDYLLKPVVVEELVEVLENVRQKLQMSRKNLEQSVYNISALSLLRDEMADCLRSGDIERIVSFMADKLDRASKHQLDCSCSAVEHIFLNVLSDYCDEEGVEFEMPKPGLSQETLITLTIDKVREIIGSLKTCQEEMVARVQAYISEHYRDPEISLSRIAQDIYVNPSYLSRVYNQVAGQSITTYIRDVRLLHAMEMLSKGECSIEWLSDAVGFRNAGYFSRCFKDKYGISPSEVKRSTV